MTSTDCVPLPNTPINARLRRSNCNNRYGAVLSALYGFWLSREAAFTTRRQDTYSVVTFGDSPMTRLRNDSTSTADQLIEKFLPQTGQGDPNFQAALAMAQTLIEAHWSSDRAPMIIFLSNGKGHITDGPVYDLCRKCVRLGKALAFHSVTFGRDTNSIPLRRMSEIAHDVFASAPQDSSMPARGNLCTHRNAIDSIQLADTFLGVSNSLRRLRASLMRR
ncbi:putative cytochrome P450 family protein [Rhizoctonia solani 123E]|nr:putative cytochrome P450 family protein [Rhizoctonia solani 123E]